MSDRQQSYGSGATIEKLDAMTRYADAYTKVLQHKPSKRNPFTLYYVDAFAGSGVVPLRGKSASDPEVEGSSLRALSTESKPFDRLLLIEKDAKDVETLRRQVESRNELERVTIIHGEANHETPKFCDWLGADPQAGTRAFVFLDPYAMQFNWQTMQMLAETKRADVLMLFPLMALRRNLKNDGWPPATHQTANMRFFGNESWKSLYATGGDNVLREGGDRAIVELYAGRMREHFVEVVDPKRTLGSFDDGSLFTMLFGASNESGARVAARIARGVFAAAQGRQGRMRL